MNPDMRVLADKKNDLLLAEIGAWLHDMGKCSDEMIEWQAYPKPSQTTFKNNRDYKIYFSNLLGRNATETIQLCSENVLLKDLIEKGEPRAITSNIPWLIRALGRCHAAAHIEKEGKGAIKQTANDTRLSNPFGFETLPLVNLTDKLKNLPFDKVTDRSAFLKALKKAFKNAPGDTERPINEVDLWDWSSIVAALYKSALAGALLGNKPEPNKLKWRLLAIRVNSEQIWGNTSKIPVLLARKEWLTNGLNNVKKLLEEDYPLGNEVYRDENGSIFVVPDIPDLLKIRDSKVNKTLEELISERLGYEGEIVVTPLHDLESWWGQNPTGRPDPKTDEIPPIGKILSDEIKKEFYSSADAKAVQGWWDDTKQNPEICTISWLRPQGSKGKARKASDYWAEKVTGRAEDWINKEKLEKTIWIDEAADINGRICLIAGKIDIKEWLEPDGFVKTLLVKPPGKGVDPVPKTPSFARIQRIWETSKTFWEEIEGNFSDSECVGVTSQRVRIIADYKPKTKNKEELVINSAFSVELDGIRFNILCAKDNEFLIIENLLRLAKLMGAEKEYLKNYESASIYIKNCISNKKILKIFDEEKSSPSRQIGELAINNVEVDQTSYVPAISILAEPSTFMAIVPADKALKALKAIEDKYGTEMNKVRNRLPLTIGLIFAKSHAPLSSIMDAGGRMLKMPEDKDTSWKIEDKISNSKDKNIIELKIKRNEQRIKVKVDTVMGDKTTPDVWYPYWQVESDASGNVPSNRTRQFTGYNQKHWAHVSDLQTGDNVKFSSSRFDFEFLDSAARRFEISYKDGKRRDKHKSNRPYYLEELTDFKNIWNMLTNNLARTQIKGMLGLIETKRVEWKVQVDNETFKQFVHDAVHNANWRNGKPIGIKYVENAAVSGKLNDIVELYMDIIKDKEEDIEMEEFE